MTIVGFDMMIYVCCLFGINRIQKSKIMGNRYNSVRTLRTTHWICVWKTVDNFVLESKQDTEENGNGAQLYCGGRKHLKG